MPPLTPDQPSPTSNNSSTSLCTSGLPASNTASHVPAVPCSPGPLRVPSSPGQVVFFAAIARSFTQSAGGEKL